jgi:putative OmpL-like beta-barrel porin-2/carboxypeptidase family protein
MKTDWRESIERLMQANQIMHRSLYGFPMSHSVLSRNRISIRFERGFMNRKRLGAVLSAFMFLIVGVHLWSIPAYGEPAPGVLHGTTLDARGLVTPQVHVTIHSIDDHLDRVVVSDGQGKFEVGNLKPGRYELMANKQGLASSQVTYLAVAAGDDLRFDMKLSGTAAGPSASSAATPAAPPAADPDAPSAVAKELEEMKERIAELEAKLKTSTPSEQPAATPAPAMESSSVAAVPMQGQAPAESSTAAPAAAPASTCCDAEVTTKSAPFSFDNTWENNTPRTKDTPLATKYFVPEIRVDTNYIESYNQPKDHTMGGSTESFRNGEVQLEQMSVGGDLRIDNVRGRLLTMNGLFATTTPRNDGSAGVGQWNLNDAYKYFSEAWGGYHFNVNHGLNIDAGIFVSYIGLFSYYNFDNWTYQPSYVSSNTPWFFNGVRIQWFPTDKLKIEPWIINGWQSYAKYNGHPGLGGQIKWIPKEWLSFVFNNYGMGTDELGIPGRSRIHTDDSVEVRYYNQPENLGLDRLAFTVTADAGCEYGGSASIPGSITSCHNDKNGHPKQSMTGWMIYNRSWFHKDLFAMTIGGGVLDNPGRYLTLLPPINGATAVSGSPYFVEAPGQPYKAWDSTITFDYMPSQFITFRFETGYRYANVPYFSGREGITPPGGNVAPVSNNGVIGTSADYICTNGTTSAVSAFAPSGSGFAIDNIGNAVGKSCLASYGSGWSAWQPDLRKSQWNNTIAIMVKF